MRVRHVAFFVTLGAGACGGSCAGTTNGVDERPPPVETQTKSYVSTEGDDNADGSEATPFRTIMRALAGDADVVVVRPGVYVEPEVAVARKVSVEGERGSVLAGHVLVANDDVRWSRVDVMGGISITLASNVEVTTATIGAGTREDTISVASSRASLSELVLKCGAETCVQATTSTASLTSVVMAPENASKRGVRAETSSVSVADVEVRGTSISQLQASGGSWMRVRGAKLNAAGGNALVALRSTMLADDVTTSGSTQLGFLTQSSTVTLRGSTIGASTTLTAGVQAGRVTILDSTLEGSPEGTLNLAAWRDDKPTVRLVRTTLAHGARVGVLQSTGTLIVEGGRFVGDPNAPAAIESADAIVATGMDSRLMIRGATFEDTAGTAILGTRHLAATITATISRPRLTGIFIEEARVFPVRILGGRIEGCQRESGLVLLDVEGARVEGLTVTGCPEAGVLTGEEAEVEVVGVRAIDNAGFGYGAFGGSTIRLRSSVARGSAWATFSTCGDGAQVIDAGGNQLSGPTTECP